METNYLRGVFQAKTMVDRSGRGKPWASLELAIYNDSNAAVVTQVTYNDVTPDDIDGMIDELKIARNHLIMELEQAGEHWVFLDVSGSSVVRNFRERSHRAQQLKGSLFAFSCEVGRVGDVNQGGSTNLEKVEEFLQEMGYPHKVTIVTDEDCPPIPEMVRHPDRWEFITVPSKD